MFVEPLACGLMLERHTVLWTSSYPVTKEPQRKLVYRRKSSRILFPSVAVTGSESRVH